MKLVQWFIGSLVSGLNEGCTGPGGQVDVGLVWLGYIGRAVLDGCKKNHPFVIKCLLLDGDVFELIQ